MIFSLLKLFSCLPTSKFIILSFPVYRVNNKEHGLLSGLIFSLCWLKIKILIWKMLFLGWVPWKQTLRQKITYRGLLQECLGRQTYKALRKTGLGKGRSWSTVQLQQRPRPPLWESLQLAWPFRGVPIEANTPTSASSHQPVMAVPGSITSGEVVLCSQWQLPVSHVTVTCQQLIAGAWVHCSWRAEPRQSTTACTSAYSGPLASNGNFAPSGKNFSKVLVSLASCENVKVLRRWTTALLLQLTLHS